MPGFMSSKITFPTFVLLSAGLFAQSAAAACKGTNCVCEPSEIQFASPVLKPGENGKFPISLEADDVEAQGEDLVSLSGNAEVSQGRQTIVADELKYYRATDRVVASGNVEMISEDGDYLSSDSIDVHAPSQIGQLDNAQFKLAQSISSADGVDTVAIASRGSADTLNLEGEGLIRMQNVRYTNCNEGNDDVIIKAGELELDQTAGIGKARNATIRFKGLPVFYMPYISFPINDERKTGFLTPGIGTDQLSGGILSVPWYWNIAKNQDATFTPRYYSDRGLQVGAEYRHRSENSSTLMYGEFMPDDDLFAGEDRSMVSIQHSQAFSRTLYGRVNYNDVSDANYFDDFRNGIGYFSASYVPRDFSLAYRGKYVSIGARAKEYQVIDPFISEDRAPYERLPSINLKTKLPKGPYGMRYGMNASFTNFSHSSRIEGDRTALTPYLSIPFENLWGYITPAVAINHRTYSLDNLAPGAEDSPSFTVPVFSVNAGIHLEKNTRWFGDAALQTLEPRIFYAYAPNEDQSDVPIFDTSQVSGNNFSNIFRANRFYGEDRVGDTNQVTLGVTTRIIDNESGDQRLKASFGQLYIIEDLEQDLFGRTIESGLGDFLAEVRTESKGPWTMYGFLQYDHDESEIRTARFAFGYEPKDDDRKRISVGYYFANGSNRDVDQLTFTANWPLSDRWQLFADERYSLEDSESLSTTVGLEYNACCWKIRLRGQERLFNQDINDKKTSVFLELELTTLGRFATSIL